MSFFKLVGSILLALVWISDSILISFVQLVLYNTLRPINRKLYRKINYYLIYTNWSQVVAHASYWSNLKLMMYFPDDDSKNKFAKEFNLTVMNHKYEIDWLCTWLAMDHFKNLGASKSYAKKALKFVPIIGWSFHFGEFIFLERSWEKDSKIMKNCLNNLKEYEDKVCLLLFAEGTRFTRDKFEQSCKFADERGLEKLKYHLIPRTRGFTYTVEQLKDNLDSLFNVQLEFEIGGEHVNNPTFTNILRGKPMTAHLYLERIPIEQVPCQSVEKLNQFLFELYHRKDVLTEEFQANKTFKTKHFIQARARLTPLLNMIFWFIAVIAYYFTIFYLLVTYKFYKLLYTIIVIFALISITALVMLVRSTKAVRGSTYGTAKQDTKSKTS